MIAPVVEKLWKKNNIMLQRKDIPVTAWYVSNFVAGEHVFRKNNIDLEIFYRAEKFEYYYMMRKIKESMKATTMKFEELLKKFLETLGLGEIKIIKYVPSKKVIFEINNPAYALHYIQYFGNPNKNICTFPRGMLAGIMSAIFNTDMDCQELKCVANRSPKCTFEISASGKEFDKEFLELYKKDVRELKIETSGFSDFFSMLMARQSLRISKGHLIYNKRSSFINPSMSPTIAYGFLEKEYGTDKAEEIMTEWNSKMSDIELKIMREGKRDEGNLSLMKKAGLKVAALTKMGIQGGYGAPMNMKFMKVDLKKEYVLMEWNEFCLCHYYNNFFGTAKVPICRIMRNYARGGLKYMLGWDVNVYFLTCFAQSQPSCFVLAVDKDADKKTVDEAVEESVDFIFHTYKVDKNEIKRHLPKNFEKK